MDNPIVDAPQTEEPNKHLENIDAWVSLSTGDNAIVNDLFSAFEGIGTIAKAISDVVALFA